MKTPGRLLALRNAKLTLRKWYCKIASITKRLESLTLEKGIALESEVQGEIQSMTVRENSKMEALPNSDFRRIFGNSRYANISLYGTNKRKFKTQFL